MESIKEIYKIGNGPSSSHTMGPKKAALKFFEENKDAKWFLITLYGSLAATGKGHLTDVALKQVFGEKLTIHWKPQEFLERHPNSLNFKAFDIENKLIDEWTAYSIGGGRIIDNKTNMETNEIYPHKNILEIINFCKQNGLTLWEYVEKFEDESLWEHLHKVWEVMQSAIERGIEDEGVLPGALNLQRKSSSYFIKAKGLRGSLKRRSLVFAYALAVAEENAAGNVISTAPTCGSCGVLPGVLYLLKTTHNFSEKKIIRAIATAGLIGNIIKENASISGAEVGCQGEIGTACSMAAAATTQLFGGTISQIEYSAEMGLEHHLGLTCDPIVGLVQVPCIERNAFAASRALDANTFAMLSDGNHMVSLDKVIKTMKETGHDLPSLYKETSEGGLAID